LAVIRAIIRALDLLRVMNESREYTLRELHDLTQLPKPTVFRILSTLQDAGYVIGQHPKGSYRISARVRELGKGYTDRSMIVEVGAPIIREITAKIKWPLAIGILEGHELAVRYSTMPESPLAVQPTTLGHRHSLLNSAMGQAYLAFCSPAEQNVLLRIIDMTRNDMGVPRERPATLLSAVRRRGYGLRMPKKKGDSGTIAVPIRHSEGVLGVLSMTTFGILMNEATIATHKPILVKTAERIATQFVAEGKASR
jgi:IclR family transcriptional regulator, mhp operon transcriptional activator